MQDPFVPILFLLILPALYLGARMGLFASPVGRWAGGAAAAVALAVSLPYDGLDLVTLKRLALFFAAAAAVLFLLRQQKVPWTLDKKTFSAALAALAALSALAYLNFFAFHGGGAFIHLHDVAHYTLGSKYYGELGYRDLYVAMLRAEAELDGGALPARMVRDLATYREVPAAEALADGERVKTGFSPARWDDFRRDVGFFRAALGERYDDLLLDHGFNATPAWALVGGALARAAPAGADGVALLALLDPLLLVALFVAIGWAFGRDAMVLAVLHWSVLFGANFAWTGGAFLRQLWIFALVVGVCSYRKQRHAAAGALFALSAGLRVFPALFLVPLAFKAAAIFRRRGRLPRRYRAFFGGFAVAGALLFAATALLPRGLDHWRAFGDNMTLHVGVVAPNVVGLTDLLARPATAGVSDPDAAAARRADVRRAQLLLVFVPLLGWVAASSPRRSDLGAMLLALPLLWAGLSLAGYYWVFLILLTVACRRSPRCLMLIFAVEAASYALMLFEDRDGMLYLYRSLLVAFLFVAVAVERLRRPAASRAPAAPAESRGEALTAAPPVAARGEPATDVSVARAFRSRNPSMTSLRRTT